MPDFGAKILRGYAIAILAIAVAWSIAYYALRLPAYLLPAPHKVLEALIERRNEVLAHASITAAEAFIGLLAAIAFGLTTGIVLFRFQVAARITMPILVATQAVPIIATAPIFMLWFGSGLLSKIILGAVLCYFPILVATLKGLGQYSGEAVESMRVQGASQSEIFWMATLPGSVPAIMNGIRTAAAMALMGAIVAEYAGASRGLGYLIIQSSYRTDTIMLFSALVVSVFCSMILISIVEIFEQVFLRPFIQTSSS